MENINTTALQTETNMSKERTFTLRETVFAFAAAALGFGFVKLTAAPLLMNTRLGLGTALFMLAVTVFSALFGVRDGRNKKRKTIRIILCVMFSVNIFISANILIQFLSLVFTVMITAYGALADRDGRLDKIRGVFPLDMAEAVLCPLSELDECPSVIKAATNKNSAAKNLRNALLGLAIAIPSTVMVCGLLMRADDGFEHIMDSLFNNCLSRVLVFLLQLLAGLPAGFYIYGMCRGESAAMAASEDYCREKLGSIRFLPSLAGVFSAVPLCFMYVIFFFSQISYFISAFMGKLPEGMDSYSEYARKGFFELCMVSVINLAVIAALNLFCKYRSDGRRPASIRAITCVLCVFTVLLIATAVSKMFMYINVYGLTRLRFYTTWFMLLLALIFAGIFIYMTREKLNLWRFITVSFTVMFALLSLSCADRLIAEYNVQRYLNGTLAEIDVSMFGELSADAVPAAEKIYYKLSAADRAELDKYISLKLHKTGDGRTLTVSELIAGESYENMHK